MPMAASWLAIETSTTRGSVALWQDGACVFSDDFVSERNHNSHLFAPLEAALAVLGDMPLAGILVGTGPGSYNGSRVAIATAQGVGIIRDCETIGICSFFGLPTVRSGAEALVCGDARRQSWYVQRVKEGKLVGETDLFEEAEFEAVISEAKSLGQVCLTTDDPERLAVGRCEVSDFTAESPEASGLITSWLSLSEEKQQELRAKVAEPEYLRPPHITLAKPRKSLGQK